MVDRIDAREVTPLTVGRMGNCRLRKTQARLNELLSLVEQEIESRIGKGGGGLNRGGLK